MSLDYSRSEVVIAIQLWFIVFFYMTDRCCFWKMVLWQSVLVWSFGTLGWSQLICCFNTEYRWAFLRLRFLAGGAS